MKTLSLVCILKDEENQLPRFFENIDGLFDEVIFVDTGSTDKSIKLIEEFQQKTIMKIKLEHFQWIEDFSAARNYGIPFVTSDYWMWLDLDDEIKHRDKFMQWKTHIMHLGDVFFAPYFYASDENGVPVVKFIRERVMKTSLDAKFIEPIHEAVLLPPGANAQAINIWYVNHKRTLEDLAKDKGRNLRVLRKFQDQLSPRLKFYLGKELFDAGDTKEASEVLKEALKNKDLGLTDRTLAFQYTIHSLLNLKQYDECTKYAALAIQMDPSRAEYHCLVADCYAQQAQFSRALPHYMAALGCQNSSESGMNAIYAFADCYNNYPRKQMAKVFFQMGNFEKAQEHINLMSTKDPEALQIEMEIEKALKATKISRDTPKCDDIVITCLPGNAYDWDEEIYKTKGLGGSETAAVEMAKWLHELTGRKVKIFQSRKEFFRSDSGVEYIPIHEVHTYFQRYQPALHIAWRHAARLTYAPSYVWSHDLMTPGIDQLENYDKLLLLSEFHKNFIQSQMNIPDDKILLTRNGIEPKRFKNLDLKKHYGRVIWPNSPDRGLEDAILIMDLVREEIPGAQLFCYYGFENMRKFGQGAKVDQLLEMISSRPWIKYVGNVDQDTLVQAFASSQVWLYPATFIETFCISGLEALLTKCYPVVKPIGALPNTLALAKLEGCASFIELDRDHPKYYQTFADEVVKAIDLQKHQDMDFDPEACSWKSVAEDWIKTFQL